MPEIKLIFISTSKHSRGIFNALFLLFCFKNSTIGNLGLFRLRDKLAADQRRKRNKNGTIMPLQLDRKIAQMDKRKSQNQHAAL